MQYDLESRITYKPRFEERVMFVYVETVITFRKRPLIHFQEQQLKNLSFYIRSHLPPCSSGGVNYEMPVKSSNHSSALFIVTRTCWHVTPYLLRRHCSHELIIYERIHVIVYDALYGYNFLKYES